MPNIKGNISAAWQCVHKGYMHSRFWVECLSDVTRRPRPRWEGHSKMYLKTQNVKMCTGFSWLSVSEVVQCDRRHSECKVISVRAIKMWRNISAYFTSALSRASGQAYQPVALSREITPYHRIGGLVSPRGDNFVHHTDVQLYSGTTLAFFGVYEESCCLQIQG
jgi:hypothetical protein